MVFQVLWKGLDAFVKCSRADATVLMEGLENIGIADVYKSF